MVNLSKFSILSGTGLALGVWYLAMGQLEQVDILTQNTRNTEEGS
jgi:hypothetical protein